MPTFCDLADVEVEGPVDGMSLLALLRGNEQITDDRYLFWVRREGGGYGGQAYYAARYKDYKILQNSAYEPFQFFKIGSDPYETTGLDTEDSEVFQDLRARLMQHIRRSGGIPWQEP